MIYLPKKVSTYVRMTTNAALGSNSSEFSRMLITGECLIYRQGILNSLGIHSQDQGYIAWTQLINDQEYQITIGYGQYYKWPLACVRCHIVYNVISLIIQGIQFALHIARLEACPVQGQVLQPNVLCMQIILQWRWLCQLLLCAINTNIHALIVGHNAGSQLHQLYNIPQCRMQQPFTQSQQMEQRLYGKYQINTIIKQYMGSFIGVLQRARCWMSFAPFSIRNTLPDSHRQ